MIFIDKLKDRFTGLTKATSRFPLTTIFLITAAITNIININTDLQQYDTHIITFLLGALLSATGQIIYERFFSNKKFYSIILMVISILLAAGYYLIIKDSSVFDIELSVRTSVAMFAVFVSFMLIPTIKREITFNESFLISFKSFFISLFFSVVIFGGIALIIGAIDQLLLDINYRWFSNSTTIIFFVFFPLFFLSMIPVFQDNLKNESQEFADIPKLLEVLISYIIIPISAILTLILIIYIVLNIRGSFWTDNLLEPMLVSYSISIILIYILSSLLENKFAALFKKIAPKILVPIVIFQVIASILKIRELGLTHGRYFVILYGVYAAITGIILSILPTKKNGVIAGLLIIFSIVSIIPPIDAFTISKNSQINNLKETLIKNQMLVNNTILPKSDLDKEERNKITSNMSYLNRMEYLDNIDFIPSDFEMYKDFQQTFGFNKYYDSGQINESIYLSLDMNQALIVQGYDFITNSYINYSEKDREIQKSLLSYKDKIYTISSKLIDENILISLLDEENITLIEFSVDEILDKYSNEYLSKNILTLEEATFEKENERAKMGIIVQDFNINKNDKNNYYWGSLHILIKIK